MSNTNNLTSPFAFILFGGTGDLTQRKLIPSLFDLFKKGVLPEQFYVVGYSRRPYSSQDYKDFLQNAVIKYSHTSFDAGKWEEFSGKIYYQIGELDNEAGYRKLIDLLSQFDKRVNACVPRFFYLATPPDLYSPILTNLYETKLSEGCGQGSDKWTKVMIEKPFGRNLEDAKNLDARLARIFKEEQIYRIDHYLGKETVQNIIAFRYGNALFEPIWNRQYIDHVQMTVAETVGVETRGNFYEGVGALRDMTQSHLLELLAAVAMEEPRTFDAEGIRDARATLIKNLNFINPKDTAKYTVRGQYATGKQLINNEEVVVKGYREEDNVNNGSNTETFVALQTTVNTKRWQGVPFYLRTGKRLMRKVTEISVVFKEPLIKIFTGYKAATPTITNVLTFKIAPQEGIELVLNAKRPGLDTVLEQRNMNFMYKQEDVQADPYERLLLDAMRGDQRLFTRTDEVVASWEFVSQIAQGWWNQGTPGFPNYAAGSWGPQAADELIARDGRAWLTR